MIASWVGAGDIVFLLFLFVVYSVPAFVIGQRRGVEAPGLAFIPIVGPWIVVLRSIGRSAWLAALALFPIVVIGLGIWAAFTVPAEHGRTRWWALPFLIPGVNIVAFWVYAFTLEPAAQAA